MFSCGSSPLAPNALRHLCTFPPRGQAAVVCRGRRGLKNQRSHHAKFSKNQRQCDDPRFLSQDCQQSIISASMESNAQGTTDPKEKPRRLFAARLKMNEPGGQKRTARLSSIPRPVRSLTCPSRFPKSRCEGFLVAARWGGQKACFPSPHPVTPSWDSSADQSSGRGGKGTLCYQHEETRLVSECTKTGHDLQNGWGVGTGPREGKAREKIPSPPFPSHHPSLISMATPITNNPNPNSNHPPPLHNPHCAHHHAGRLGGRQTQPSTATLHPQAG